MRFKKTLCIIAFLFFFTLQAHAFAPDAYEPDDNASLAKVIVVNDTSAQLHNFHKSGDEDWVKFYGLVMKPPSSPYTITVKPVGINCRPAVELYNSHGELKGSSSIPDDITGLITVGLDCDNEDIYYVKVKSRNPDISGDATDYELTVTVPRGPDGTGIVIGMVTDSVRGEPLDGVLIKTTLNVTAISQGGMYIMAHPAGMFTLYANMDGFLPFSSGFSLNAGETISKDIKMISPGSSTTSTIPCPAESLYGEASEEIQIIRTYRDSVLAKTSTGQKVILLYYFLSPEVSKMLKQNEKIKKNVKHSIDAIIPTLKKNAFPVD